MLKIEDAIRVEKYRPPSKDGGPKNQYIFKCSQCPNEIKVKNKKRLNTATGLCVKCNNARMHDSAVAKRRLRPFEAMLNRIKDSAIKRGIDFGLFYEDFLEFVKRNNCHYCHSVLKFFAHGNSTYNLDRKDNKKGYIKDNLVVCCGKCNKGKRELYSYEEWFGMTSYFRNKKASEQE